MSFAFVPSRAVLLLPVVGSESVAAWIDLPCVCVAVESDVCKCKSGGWGRKPT